MRFSSDTMIAHSKPIALPNTNNSQLSYTDGFYTDTFNPASFTRHFLGSPISWRPSSFSAPTAQLLSKTPMDDSLLNAVNVFEREGELVCLLLLLPYSLSSFSYSAATTPVAISNSTTSMLSSNTSNKSTSWSSIPPPLNLRPSYKSLSIQSYTTPRNPS